MALPREQEGDTSSSRSRWEQLPPDVLASIFHFLSIESVLVASRVCRAWQTSSCLELFLSTGVLNLRPLDRLQGSSKRQYAKLLGIILSIPSSYSCWDGFITPREVAMPISVLLDLARRTPRLRFVSLPPRSVFSSDDLDFMLLHWRKLEGFHALFHRSSAARALSNLGIRCKKIRLLSLCTRIGIREAEIIAKSFPRLKSLKVSRCMVTVESLNLILDGSKRLKKLDIRHSKFLDEEDKPKELTRAVVDKASVLGDFRYCENPVECAECWTESFLF